MRAQLAAARGAPSYFRWGLPSVIIGGPAETGLDFLQREIESQVTLVRNESLQLPIYMFLKMEHESYLKLNIEGEAFKLYPHAAPLLVPIQFLARNYSDDEPRKFLLHLESLDKVGLTQQS